jgi:hypothetical protein
MPRLRASFMASAGELVGAVAWGIVSQTRCLSAGGHGGQVEGLST